MKKDHCIFIHVSKFEFEEISQSIKCTFVFANFERVLVASSLHNLYCVQFVPVFTDKIMKKKFEVSSQDSHYRYSSSVVNDHD